MRGPLEWKHGVEGEKIEELNIDFEDQLNQGCRSGLLFKDPIVSFSNNVNEKRKEQRGEQSPSTISRWSWFR